MANWLGLPKMANWLGLPLIEEYSGLNLKSLPLNHAYVIVNTSFDDVGVYSVQKDCFQCPFKLMKSLKAGEEASWQVDTSAQNVWQVLNFGNYGYVANSYRGGLICRENPTPGEFGVYRLQVGECVLDTEVPPINPYLPLLLSGVILLAWFLLTVATKRILKYRMTKGKEEKVLNIERAGDRTTSLQILRGFLMMVIIFTTSGGGGYPFFTRKVGGLTIPEIAFCGLAWAVGVHIPYSVDRDLAKGRKKLIVLRNILLRWFCLVFTSVIIDSTDLLNVPRQVLWSPLKRLGISYLLAAFVYTVSVQRVERKSKALFWKVTSTTITLIWSWVLIGLCLTLMVICMSTLATLNDCLDDRKTNYSNTASDVIGCSNGYTKLIMDIFLDERRSNVDVNGYFGYGTGLLGLLSTILYTILGLKAGVVLAHFESKSDRWTLWAIWATFFGLVGLVLVLIPVSLNLWPIASILFISSISTLILMLFFWFSDHLQDGLITSLGTSHLPILFGHLLLAKTPPFFFSTVNSHFWYLWQNIWAVVLWTVVGEVLVRKNLRVNV